ncbi:response regulator [Lysobacter enzymogenes]|uniref:Transcriptional regulatory protein, C terminal-DNA-binding response regulator n=1 Tax=Lysobacter enzymogenes TaxID=69 RepID=A0A0S2DH98_LYSEN|nr:response regulator transcription factor [Lysobacter enzymogenes]ALN57913.1 Transcriptional regulatory protein, C terminal - DNA-binding response regulator [Lysobacter enzymogenes]QCW26425.1 response regulator transcription factor [Lysobacter enzymogenes]QQQ03723.1 response regulator transcription factor [Lysobacter enzymogenes]UZW58428.1 response regulator transcription factor [Lysobacter enzymogenes]
MRILLVEDDQGLSQALKSALAAHSIVLDVAADLGAARRALSDADYRVLILDWQLPDGEGISLIPLARRAQPGLPVLILTARHQVEDRIQGLDAGADDYITKPFDVNELLARIRAVCRRPTQQQIPSMTLGALQFDFGDRCASLHGVRLNLPRRQLLVLEALCLRAGRTVSRAKLQEAVYGFDDNIESNTLESHISRLRRTLAPAGIEIHAMRGLGYLLQAADGADES